MAKFQKGQSGNPGGRKPMPEELKTAMRGLAPTAVQVLEKAMRESLEDGKPSTRDGILAANTILDRGYGKATQPIVAEGIDAGAAHLEALQALGTARRAAEPDKTDTASTAAPLADDGEKPHASRIN